MNLCLVCHDHKYYNQSVSASFWLLKKTHKKDGFVKGKEVKGLISVIMPCFNAGKFLVEAIESVLQQSYTHTELIIVDDGSTDNSNAILKDYENRITVIRQERQGPYPARNKGIEKCNGEYVAFLDADDYWAEDCLKELYDTLHDKNCALAYCGWQNVGIPGKSGDPFIPSNYETPDKIETFLSAASKWPIHAALTRKSVLNEVGGFDENFKTCMDYDLWLRIASNHSICLVEKVLAFYRHHEEGQITSKQWRQAINVRLIKNKFLSNYPESIKDIPKSKLREYIDGTLLQRGYTCYWKRDLVSARKIFHASIKTGYWGFKDLKYLLPSLLPEKLYLTLIGKIDG